MGTEAVRQERYAKSRSYMARASQVIPRGVTSAKRGALRPTPLAFSSAAGSHLVDVDGNDYVDYVAGYGPILLGHGFEPVNAAVTAQMSKGTLFGAQHIGEAALAELLVHAVPSAERVLFNVSGSEAAHGALRLARAATGRRLIVRFEGHYHGWIDPIPPNRVDGVIPTPAARIAPAYAFSSNDVLICPWNDPEAFRKVMDEFGRDVAAVILEPVAVNAGCLAPDDGYLREVRELCTKHDAVLIFDEVITGFRLALGGAQERFGVCPDLTVLGKAIASGYPLSAVVGRADIMSEAEDRISWAGTCNGQALAVAASLATISYLDRHRDEVYGQLEDTSTALVDRINEAGQASDVPLTASHVGSLVRLYWDVPSPSNRYENVLRQDADSLISLSERLIDLGIHSRESGQWYVSMAHTQADVKRTGDALEMALVGLNESRAGVKA